MCKPGTFRLTHTINIGQHTHRAAQPAGLQPGPSITFTGCSELLRDIALVAFVALSQRYTQTSEKCLLLFYVQFFYAALLYTAFLRSSALICNSSVLDVYSSILLFYAAALLYSSPYSFYSVLLFLPSCLTYPTSHS